MQTIVLGTPSAERSLSSVVDSSGHEEIEIVNADGSVIAHLVPALDVSDEIYQRVAEEYRQDAAELQRRLANRTPGRTTAEVMERLQVRGHSSFLGRPVDLAVGFGLAEGPTRTCS